MRALLLCMVVCGVVFSTAHRAHKQRSAVERLGQINRSAIVRFDFEVDSQGDYVGGVSPLPSWLSGWFDVHYVASVAAVELHYADQQEFECLERFQQLRRLDLRESRHVSDAGLARLRGMQGLKTLVLEMADEVTDAGLAHVSRLSNLRRFTYDPGSHVTPTGLAQLARLTQLQTLDLQCFEPGAEAGLNALVTLKNLRSLTLRCSGDTPQALGWLTALTNLVDLKLVGCANLTGSELEPLARLPRLQRLVVIDCDRVSLEHVPQLAHVRELDLRGCARIDDDDLAAVARMPELQHLTLYACPRVSQQAIEAVARTARLSTFRVDGRSIAPQPERSSPI